MHPPVRDQADIGTIDQGLDASDGAIVTEQDGSEHENKDTARQEYKDEADTNYMLSKFGITQPRNSPTFGEWDDSIDLQQAIEATREAKQAFQKLPKELIEKFPRMEDILTAINNGSLVIKDEKAPESEPPKPPA